MHDSTMLRMEWFVKHYVKGGNNKKVLDVGSYDVNGTYKQLFKGIDICYNGLDIEMGPNVDIVMESPYEWNNVQDNSYDYAISGQAFEHIEFPWLTMKEIYKKVKPGGIICIIAPNGCPEHKYPYDCWRFFGDGMSALAKWAGFEVIDVTVGGVPDRSAPPEWDGIFNDACLIAVKPDGTERNLEEYPRLPYERRYDEAKDKDLRYEFLWRWIHLDYRRERITRLLLEKNIKNVFIYGYGYIAKLFCEDALEIEDVNWYVIDRYKAIEEKGIINCKFGEKPDNLDHAMMIITVLDNNRDFTYYLDTFYKGIPKYYIDEILWEKLDGTN